MRNYRNGIRGFLASLLLSGVAHAQPTLLKWFGHAAFQITTPKGHVILIDPWISNPTNPDVKNLPMIYGGSPVGFVVAVKGMEMTPGSTIKFEGAKLVP